MFCNYCGQPNPDDANFCRACGRQTVQATAAASARDTDLDDAAPVDMPASVVPDQAPPAFVEPETPPGLASAASVAAASAGSPGGAPRLRSVLLSIGAVVAGMILIRGWLVYQEDRQEAQARAARETAVQGAQNREAAAQIFGTYKDPDNTIANSGQADSNPAPATASVNFPPDTSDPDAVQCDRLADHPSDPQRVGDGVNLPMIDVAQALTACERAASQTPPRPRYQYLYGRVLGAASRPMDALGQYVRAQRAGYAMADLALGLVYEDGIGVTANRATAIDFLTRADAAGVRDVRSAMGDLFLYGTPPDYQQAKTWYESAIQRDEPQGYAGLAVLYDLGLGVSEDRVKGAGLARKAGDLGNVNGMYWTGRHFMDGQGVAKDGVAACQWFERAAQQNYAYAQLEIGRCFYNGTGVDQNHASAFSWLIRAARAGLPPAQELVGDMYDSGDGVAADQTQAVAWYRKAAELDDAYGMMQLGTHLRLGRGVAWSEAEAMQWFEKAARQGYAAAQSSLAEGYLVGFGQSAGQGRQDYQQAAYWFDLAAKQGEGFALLNLGVMHENGWGVPQNPERATQLYAQAAQSSNAEAAKVGQQYYEGLSSAMTQKDVSQRTRVGKPSNADAWVGMIVTVVAVAALVEVFGHSSGSSSDRSNVSASSSGGSDVTPSWDNWSASVPTPVAVDPPTRPSLYYPSNPTRSVNGDLTDPSIARR